MPWCIPPFPVSEETSMYLVAFLGGVLTLFSPCVLPVLPLLFSRAGGPAWNATVIPW